MWNTINSNKKNVTPRFLSGKTKIIITAMFFYSITYSAFAQFEKKKDYKWGLSFAVNDAHSQIAFLGGAGLQMDAEGNMISGGEKTNKSYSLSIIPKYYINNEWLIRFEYGMTQIDLENKGVSTSSGYFASHSYFTNYDTIEQKINRFVLGIQWNFFTTKKIQSYGGVNLPFIKYGAITRKIYGEARDIATDTLIERGTSIYTIPGGFATGIGVFAGFNVYVMKHLSLGAEFSSSLLFYNINVGGESTMITSSQSPSNAPWRTTTYTNKETYKGTRFAKILSSFNLTFWL